jgi:transcriptional antiterminator RfaH
MNGESCWYLVQTRPHSERKAAEHLLRQGFETYLPCYLKRRRHARRVETIASPLFPRYLFVAVNMVTQRWLSIRSTIGVSALVSCGDRPAEVADGIIRELRGREVGGMVALDQRQRFRRGDQVRITDGAFAGCLGLFEDMPDRERIAVLLDLLGRKVRVLIDELSVAAA